MQANQLLVCSWFYLTNISNPRNLKPKLAGQGTTIGKGHTMKLSFFFLFYEIIKNGIKTAFGLCEQEITVRLNFGSHLIMEMQTFRIQK